MVTISRCVSTFKIIPNSLSNYDTLFAVVTVVKDGSVYGYLMFVFSFVWLLSTHLHLANFKLATRETNNEKWKSFE